MAEKPAAELLAELSRTGTVTSMLALRRTVTAAAAVMLVVTAACSSTDPDAPPPIPPVDPTQPMRPASDEPVTTVAFHAPGLPDGVHDRLVELAAEREWRISGLDDVGVSWAAPATFIVVPPGEDAPNGTIKDLLADGYYTYVVADTDTDLPQGAVFVKRPRVDPGIPGGAQAYADELWSHLAS